MNKKRFSVKKLVNIYYTWCNTTTRHLTNRSLIFRGGLADEIFSCFYGNTDAGP